MTEPILQEAEHSLVPVLVQQTSRSRIQSRQAVGILVKTTADPALDGFGFAYSSWERNVKRCRRAYGASSSGISLGLGTATPTTLPWRCSSWLKFNRRNPWRKAAAPAARYCPTRWGQWFSYRVLL